MKGLVLIGLASFLAWGCGFVAAAQAQHQRIAQERAACQAGNTVACIDYQDELARQREAIAVLTAHQSNPQSLPAPNTYYVNDLGGGSFQVSQPGRPPTTFWNMGGL